MIFLGKSKFNDSRNNNNFYKLANNILEYKSPEIYANSKTEGDGRKMRRLLEHNDFSVDLINSELLHKERIKLCSGANYIPIDGSEMRKSNSKKMENLMKVRELGGKLVNGYRTVNAILIQKNKIQLLCTIPYSSSADDFKSENTITFNLMDNISKSIDKGNNHITYLLDSKYDDQKYFERIAKEEDFFIVRVKHLKRRVLDNRGKSRALVDLKYRKIGTIEYETIFVVGKKYKNVRAHFSYASISYKEQKLTVINVKLQNGKGNDLFEKPFYIITNITYSRFSKDRIVRIYNAYLKRWKIELVFKFLKNNLGWEKFGLKSYKANKNLIAMTFMVAAYLYEIEEVDVDEQILSYLAYIGRGKGKISKKYILQGIEKIITVNSTIESLRENYTEEQIDEIHKALKLERMF